MASTAHKDKKMMEELRETDDAVDVKAQQVAALLRASKHSVAFTGAGISTSTGIPDYRGPDGVWTLAAENRKRTRPAVDMQRAIPSQTHMSLVALMNNNLLHHVISQNVDGLHRKSGIAAQNISELHGNSNMEQCDGCGKYFLRDFTIVGHDHFTGRMCDTGCGGNLKDTIINFGENLPPLPLSNGFSHSEGAKVHMCLGSSLTVRPACDMPRATKEKGGKLVIVNLQRTPLDDICDIRVHSTVDQFMSRLMHHLALPVPEFRLTRHLTVWRGDTDKAKVSVCGIDTSDQTPFSLFRAVAMECGGRKTEISDIQAVPVTEDMRSETGAVALTLDFFGHYNEPTLKVVLPASAASAGFTVSMDPVKDTEWTITPVDHPVPSFAAADGTAVLKRGDKAPSKPSGVDYSGWFAVTPLDECEHCQEARMSEGLTIDLQAACASCGNVGENMLCMVCHEVHCGRHVRQHMLDHNKATGHSLVAGFIDLSFWCYGCEAYIAPNNEHVLPFYAAMHMAKFGSLPPMGPRT